MLATKPFVALAVLITLAPHVRAATYVVDAAGGPGSQFTQISAALAVAQPADVILVRAGTYNAFTTAEGVVILSISAPVLVNGTVVVTGIPSTERAVVVGVQPLALVIDACSGSVVVQDCTAHAVSATNCLDVRLERVVVAPPNGPTVVGLAVHSSRVQVADCDLSGTDGEFMATVPQDGGQGALVDMASFVHSESSIFRGGDGSPSWTFQTIAGSGGAGLFTSTAQVRTARSTFLGGLPGTCLGAGCFATCIYDGLGGPGATNTAAALFDFNVSDTFTGQPSYVGSNCIQVPGTPRLGSGFALVTPEDPRLALSALPGAGQALTILLEAPPASTALIWFGRQWIVQPTPGVAIENLVTRDWVRPLGVVGPSGTITIPFTVPAVLPPGTYFGLQAELVLPGGEIRRTVSRPLVVR